MGYMRHHAIIVTGPADKLADVRARVVEIAEEKFTSGLISGIVLATTNGYASFMVAPDGSKEGWDESGCGDKMRDEVIAYLESLRYEDGSTSFPYVEVQFADDNLETKVCRSSTTANVNVNANVLL